MPCFSFSACVKKDLEAKLAPIIEKIVQKILDEKLAKKVDDIILM